MLNNIPEYFNRNLFIRSVLEVEERHISRQDLQTVSSVALVKTKRELCPSSGKTCHKCKGKNHFAEKCRVSKRRINAVQNNDGGVKEINDSSLSDYESVATIAVNNVAEKYLCGDDCEG